MARSGDVFPRRNLGPGEEWGREVERRFDRVSSDTKRSLQLVSGTNRAAISRSDQARDSASEAQANANQALADAALAKTTADGKNAIFAQVSEPTPGAQGDLWYQLNEFGVVTGIQVWNGSEWVDYLIVADSILVPGSVGAVQIADGAITATKIQGQELVGITVTGGTVQSEPSPQGDYAHLKAGEFTWGSVDQDVSRIESGFAHQSNGDRPDTANYRIDFTAGSRNASETGEPVTGGNRMGMSLGTPVFPGDVASGTDLRNIGLSISSNPGTGTPGAIGAGKAAFVQIHPRSTSYPYSVDASNYATAEDIVQQTNNGPRAMDVGGTNVGNFAEGDAKNTAITFPSGRFSSAPVVMASSSEVRISTAVHSRTSSGFTLRAWCALGSASNVTVYWQATEMF